MYAKNSVQSRAVARSVLYLMKFVAVPASLVLLAAVPGCKKAEPPKTAATTTAVATGTAAPATTAPTAAKPAAQPSSQPSTQPSAAAPSAAVKLQTQTSTEVKMGDTTKCPIMKEEFVVESDSDFALWNGKKIYFCCPGKCKKKFEKEPLKFLQQS